MKFLDITTMLDESTPIYKGDPKFSVETFHSIEQDGYTISKLRMGSHAGTHIDAPSHFVENGKKICEMSLKATVGACVVLSRLADYRGQADKILLRTGAGRLDLKQAEMLVDERVTLVGTENMSIGDDSVHRMLLKNGCVILEKIDLTRVRDGNYLLSAAPLKIEADGSPVRAFLIEMDE